jgi:hypothetical protein
MNMRVPIRRRDFRTGEFHAVASGRLGLVERHISLVKKSAHGEQTSILAMMARHENPQENKGTRVSMCKAVIQTR